MNCAIPVDCPPRRRQRTRVAILSTPASMEHSRCEKPVAILSSDSVTRMTSTATLPREAFYVHDQLRWWSILRGCSWIAKKPKWTASCSINANEYGCRRQRSFLPSLSKYHSLTVVQSVGCVRGSHKRNPSDLAPTLSSSEVRVTSKYVAASGNQRSVRRSMCHRSVPGRYRQRRQRSWQRRQRSWQASRTGASDRAPAGRPPRQRSAFPVAARSASDAGYGACFFPTRKAMYTEVMTSVYGHDNPNPPFSFFKILEHRADARRVGESGSMFWLLSPLSSWMFWAGLLLSPPFSACDFSERSPVVLVPGLSGSVFRARLNNTSPPHSWCKANTLVIQTTNLPYCDHYSHPSWRVPVPP